MAEVKDFLQPFRVGDLLQIEGIAEGTENSNFKIATTKGQYVLTVFESLTEEQLPFYLQLMNHLYLKGVPCAHPVTDYRGHLYDMLCGKPAVIVPFIEGVFLVDPWPKHCFAVGDWLSHMHQAGQNFSLQKDDERGIAWQKEALQALTPFLSKEEVKMLAEELAFQESLKVDHLPQGPIHADLFRDNVLFKEDHIAGVIDFYFAFTGPWIYDIAVTLNDWCIKADGDLDHEKMSAFFQGYMKTRTLMFEERQLLMPMLRRAALRFWVSRLYAFYLPRESQLAMPKDPTHFKMILEKRKSAITCS